MWGAPEEHADKGKRPLVHVATTERRIRFREVELKPKQTGDAPTAAVPSTAPKSSSVAKKVQSQMDRVMSGSAGPARRGRGGRKRGLTRPEGKLRAAVDESTIESQEQKGISDLSEQVAMDTS